MGARALPLSVSPIKLDNAVATSEPTGFSDPDAYDVPGAVAPMSGDTELNSPRVRRRLLSV